MAENDPVQFTRGSARRIGKTVRWWERRADNKPRKKKQRDHRPIIEDRFLAIITGNASLATNRWKYAWSEVLPNGDTVSTRSGGRSGTTSTDYAVNLEEMYHTSTYAWGVDTTGSDYSGSSFAPRPVGGGGTANTHRYNVAVEMIQVYKPDGTKKFYFSAFGSHDGGC